MTERWWRGELRGNHVGVAHDYETSQEHKLHFREIHRWRMGWDLLFEQQLQWNDWDGEQEGGGSGTRYLFIPILLTHWYMSQCQFETTKIAPCI